MILQLEIIVGNRCYKFDSELQLHILSIKKFRITISTLLSIPHNK